MQPKKASQALQLPTIYKINRSLHSQSCCLDAACVQLKLMKTGPSFVNSLLNLLNLSL